MNVTLKLPDDLVRKARHLAIEEDKSLSAWMADLVRKQLSPIESGSWIDAFSGDPNDAFLKQDIPFENRKSIPNREFSFDSNES